MNRKLIIALLLLCCPRPSQAESAGASPYNFLFLDAGARPVALGGAYTALARDANALLYNPAGLGEVSEQQAVFMHNRYFQDITQEYLAYASPQGWGASVNYLDFGSAPRTTISNHAGGLGSVGLTDIAVSAGYGAPMGVNFVGGAAIKFIQESIAGVSGTGFGLDLGVFYYPGGREKTVLGASVQNLGPSVKFQNKKEAMPLNVRVGAAHSFSVRGQDATVSADLSKALAEKLVISAGVETIVSRLVAVRFGYTTRNEAGSGLTMGLGYGYQDFSFDYAFVPFGDLGAAHRLSVGYKWGGDARTVRSAEEVKKSKAEDKAATARTAVEFEKLMAAGGDDAEQKNYKRAAISYEKAAALRPQDPEARLLLAETLLKANRLKEADEAYAAALKLLPENDRRTAGIYEQRGNAMAKLRKLSAARKYYERSAKAAEEQQIPGGVLERAYYGIAWCLDKDDSTEEAIRAYRRALQVASEPLRKQIEKRLVVLENNSFVR
ncbi:MAG TPA: hypothetical protein DCZ92_11715 [Elusimicrobia bacterium]|nr:MAG: hypothetical protein A2016_03040 [Elusimicrobia bacterium GWF2_62_30]HBA61458.1 hypothetical protein [Elusimicrobiota bacterium]